jgi:DNA-binding NtrC family response regulator
MDVLMIEDDVMSIDALKTAMEETGYKYNLVSVDSTESALRYLNRSTPYSEMPIPDVIFIDMCSKKINSSDIINFINSERVLKEIPTFTAFEDVKIMNNTIIEDLSYSCKMKKPFTPKKVKECLLNIGKLWHLTGTNNLALGRG